MITKNDLETVSTYVAEVDGALWHKVQHKDERFLLVATDLTEDKLAELADEYGIMMVLPFLTGQLPMKDTAVFRADEDWDIIGECSEKCGEGMCTRRVAERSDVADIDVAYGMLVDALNA